MKPLLISCFLIVSLQWAVFEAKVIKITDGDSIVVLTEDKKQLKVRLEGIDCPERNQDYGSKAKQFTADFCFSETVRVKKTGVDQYGRTLAFVYVDGKCLNEELLRVGMAWHFKKYNRSRKLAELENRAKRQKVGLWSQPDPIPPWEYRRKR